MMYPKLALTNLKKNRKTYIPYFLTSIICVMMFYVMSTISKSSGIDRIQGAADLKIILSWTAAITGIFTIIFLFYTNSFLVKQRKKEFGLYQVLGMDRRNLAKMMIWETLLTTLSSLVMGILMGELLGRLMFLTLLKMVHFPSPLQFETKAATVGVTVLLFLSVFTITLLFNLFKVQKSNPTNLMQGQYVGEREPKANWLLALFGTATLGGGYFIAQTVKSPLAVVGLFFIAVILVIVGTYCLFTAGSIVVLKLLKKNKNFFYKSRHFISISGMIYRMKQNAAGLANICIMSTVVLVLVSVTTCTYIGIEDLLKNRFPSEVNMTVGDISTDNLDRLNQIVEEESEKYGIQVQNRRSYKEGYLPIVREGKSGRLVLDRSLQETSKEGEIIFGRVIPLSDYNGMTGQMEELGGSQILVFGASDNFSFDTIKLENETFHVKKEVEPKGWKKNIFVGIEEGVIVMSDEAVDTQLQQKGELSYYDYLDLSGSKKDKEAVVAAMSERVVQEVPQARFQYRDWEQESTYTLYGGFLFLGIFVGALFLMATVLTIYYKQISEGYEDRSRYQIMQKVGMSRKEVQGSIKSQVLMVFFLPLMAAVIHVAFAFKVMTKLLSLLYLTNVSLFVGCTIGSILCFALLYALVFMITSREYYKIVQ